MGRRGRKLKEKMKIKMRSEDTCMEGKKPREKRKEKGKWKKKRMDEKKKQRE